MVSVEHLAALVAATAVLVLIPGPNVALIVARSLQYGVRAGVLTTLGTTLGVAVQLALVFVGITAAVELAASLFSVLRWAGIAYLVWLAYQQWHAESGELQIPHHVPARAELGRGFLIALMNPKVLIFNAAFLPQFVVSSQPLLPQLAVVSTVYLLVLFAGDVLWSVGASAARPWFARYSSIRNKLGATFYAAAGIGLALARRGD